LSVPEWQVLRSFATGPHTQEQVFEHITHYNAVDDPLGSLDSTGAQVAFAKCMSNGWLQVETKETRESIKEYLARTPAIGPLQEQQPLPGPSDEWRGVDFSIHGAELFRQTHTAIFGSGVNYRQWALPLSMPIHWEEAVHEAVLLSATTQVYYTNANAAFGPLNVHRQHHPHWFIADPRPIGAWCIRWWEMYPSGYILDVQGDTDCPSLDWWWRL
jgi:hypothetical protein